MPELVVEDIATFTQEGNSSVHSVTLPTTSAGELLVMIFNPGTDTFVSASPPSGWSLLDARDSSGITYVFIKEADGTEGATASVSLGASRRGTAITMSISGWTDTPPEIEFASTNVNDPPSIGPSWGGPSLIIAGLTNLRSDNDVTAAPSDYTGLVTIANDSSSFNSRTRSSVAFREISSGSEDPGPFSTSGTIDQPHSFTIAITGEEAPKKAVGYEQSLRLLMSDGPITVHEQSLRVLGILDPPPIVAANLYVWNGEEWIPVTQPPIL